MSNHAVRNTDSSNVPKIAAKELVTKSNSDQTQTLQVDNLEGGLIWSDETFVQLFVKALCTNYNLD